MLFILRKVKYGLGCSLLLRRGRSLASTLELASYVLFLYLQPNSDHDPTFPTVNTCLNALIAASHQTKSSFKMSTLESLDYLIIATLCETPIVASALINYEDCELKLLVVIMLL